MNVPLIHDAIDLLRWRTAPLAQYQYPLSHLLIAYAALGIMSAATAHASGATGDPLQLSFFFALYVMMETSLYATFMRWWLRRGGTVVAMPLLGLVTAANLIKLLEPLTSWLPDDVGQGMAMVLSALGLIIVLRALSRTTGASMLRTLAGTLLFAPVALLLMFSLLNVATSMGVAVFPPEVMQQISQGS